MKSTWLVDGAASSLCKVLYVNYGSKITCIAHAGSYLYVFFFCFHELFPMICPVVARNSDEYPPEPAQILQEKDIVKIAPYCASRILAFINVIRMH